MNQAKKTVLMYEKRKYGLTLSPPKEEEQEPETMSWWRKLWQWVSGGA